MSKDARPIFMAPPETTPLLNRTVFGSEHDDYRRGVRNFFEAEVYPHWEAWEAQGHVDRDLWNKAGAAGMLCVTMPEAFGGLGADRLFATIVMEEQARVGASGPRRQCLVDDGQLRDRAVRGRPCGGCEDDG